MSEPIGQHIVPRCYLQKFATKRRKEIFLVDVLLKRNTEIKIHQQNIKNICKIREFYTFDGLPESEKRWLEKYYSHHIESLYQDIYAILTDPSVEKITPDQKMKILVYIISQELRTTKIANALNSLMKGVLEYTFLAHEQLGAQKKIVSDDGTIIDLEDKTLEDAIKESNNSNRQAANLESVKRLKRIAELKSDYHIIVVKYKGEIGLISSDRPVLTNESMYSPDCKIKLPIDKNHIVCLYPYDKEIEADPDKILRLEHNKYLSMLSVLHLNVSQIEQSDHFIYGNKTDIEESLKHYNKLLDDSKKG